MDAFDLQGYNAQFTAISEQAREVTAGLDEPAFNWRPSSGGWSIEECLAHLIIVGQRQLLALEDAIQQGRERGKTGDRPFVPGPVERYILGLTEPPVREPIAAPPRFQPLHGQPLTAVLPTFLHLQSQFALQAEAARGLDLRRVKVASPVSRLLRMSLGAAFAQAAAHERRHLQQAWKVRRQLP